MISRVPSGRRRVGLASGSAVSSRARLDDMHRVVAGAGHKQPAIGGQGHVVGPQPHGNVPHAAPLLRIHDADAAAAPVADIQMPAIRAQHTGVRVLPDRDGRFERQRDRVDHPDFVVAFVADIQLPGSRTDREPGEKHRVISGWGRRHGKIQAGLAVGELKEMNLAGVAAGDEKFLAVRREGQAIPSLRQWDELRLLAIGDIDHRDPVLGKTAMHSHQPFLVRRNRQLEGQIAHRHLRARRRDTPAVEQQVLIGLETRFEADIGTLYVFARLADRGVSRHGGGYGSQDHRGGGYGLQKDFHAAHRRIFGHFVTPIKPKSGDKRVTTPARLTNYGTARKKRWG